MATGCLRKAGRSRHAAQDSEATDDGSVRQVNRDFRDRCRFCPIHRKAARTAGRYGPTGKEGSECFSGIALTPSSALEFVYNITVTVSHWHCGGASDTFQLAVEPNEGVPLPRQSFAASAVAPASMIQSSSHHFIRFGRVCPHLQR